MWKQKLKYTGFSNEKKENFFLNQTKELNTGRGIERERCLKFKMNKWEKMFAKCESNQAERERERSGFL